MGTVRWCLGSCMWVVEGDACLEKEISEGRFLPLDV